MRWLLGFLIAAGLVGAWFVWRSATEPSRRYERIHSLIAAHRLANLDDWTEEEGRFLWGDLDWFARKSPAEFDARLIGSILEGAPADKDRALRLARDVLHFNGWGGPARRQHALPRIPHPRSLDVFASRFGFPDMILREPRALAAFIDHPDASVRAMLFYLDDRRPGPATSPALLRMAESDPLQDLRLGAMYRLAEASAAPGPRTLFRRLLADRSTGVQATSAAILAVWGDPAAVDVLLGFVVDAERQVEVVELSNALAFAARGEEFLAWDLPGLRRDVDPPGSGEFIEAFERLLRSLERRRVGERLEPPAPE